MISFWVPMSRASFNRFDLVNVSGVSGGESAALDIDVSLIVLDQSSKTAEVLPVLGCTLALLHKGISMVGEACSDSATSCACRYAVALNQHQHLSSHGNQDQLYE